MAPQVSPDWTVYFVPPPAGAVPLLPGVWLAPGVWFAPGVLLAAVCWAAVWLAGAVAWPPAAACVFCAVVVRSVSEGERPLSLPPPTSLLTPKARTITTIASANSPIVATGMLTPPDRGRGPMAPALEGRRAGRAPFPGCPWGRGGRPLRSRPWGARDGGGPPAERAAPADAAAAAPVAVAAAGAATPGTPSPR